MGWDIFWATFSQTHLVTLILPALDGSVAQWTSHPPQELIA
jgi:hypothetical protein